MRPLHQRGRKSGNGCRNSWRVNSHRHRRWCTGANGCAEGRRRLNFHKSCHCKRKPNTKHQPLASKRIRKEPGRPVQPTATLTDVSHYVSHHVSPETRTAPIAAAEIPYSSGNETSNFTRAVVATGAWVKSKHDMHLICGKCGSLSFTHPPGD